MSVNLQSNCCRKVLKNKLGKSMTRLDDAGAEAGCSKDDHSAPTAHSCAEFTDDESETESAPDGEIFL